MDGYRVLPSIGMPGWFTVIGPGEAVTPFRFQVEELALDQADALNEARRRRLAKPEESTLGATDGRS